MTIISRSLSIFTAGLFFALPSIAHAVATISVSDPSVLEGNAGTTTVQFVVTCDPCMQVNATVHYHTQDGTATTADSDYVAKSTPPGQIDVGLGNAKETHVIEVTVNGDATPEADENFEMVFEFSVGSPSLVFAPGHDDTVGGTPTSIGQATILDDDTGVNTPPTAEAGGPYNVNEGGSVGLSGSGSSDAEQATNTLTFAWDLDNNGSFETPGISPTFSAASLDGPSVKNVGLRVTDDGALMHTDTATINILNVAPVANNDGGVGFTTDEDSSFTTANVLSNDTDVVGDPLTVSAFDTSGTIGIVTSNGNGTFGYNPNGQFDYLSASESTTDSFGYTANDGDGGSNNATVTITINGVNDAPVISAVTPSTQTVDYSDWIIPFDVTVTDIDTDIASPVLTLGDTGSPLDLGLTFNDDCIAFDSNGGQVCTWTYSGQVLDPEADYIVEFKANDGSNNSAMVSYTVKVVAEQASVSFDPDNPVSVLVAAPGSDESEPFSMTVFVNETTPDQAVGTAAPGDIDNAVVNMKLNALVGGGMVSVLCTEVGPTTITPDYTDVLEVQCDFDQIPVNIYHAEVAVSGGYYSGAGEDVITVFDPSLGFTTGGGWFYWPDTCSGFPEECDGEYLGDKTNLGYTMKYNTKGNKLKGSLLLIRHAADGEIYRIKSNALYGLALSPLDSPFGFASFSGKSTYREPGWEDSVGNHEFIVYVEDHGEQGCNQVPGDYFWIEVQGKDGETYLDGVPLNLGDMPEVTGTDLECGNIVVPHTNANGMP